MTTNLSVIGLHKVKNVLNGQSVELKSLWQDQDAAVVFFRRWGCMFCKLWAKELSEIAPILRKNNVKLVGVGIEETGYKEFVDGKYFDGDLYYVEDQKTYQELGFKRFNVVSIITSLFWKQSRDAIAKGKSMGLPNNFQGPWGQTGGMLLVGSGGALKTNFVQSGPADHLPNLEILKHFGLESEYKPEMANKERNDQCPPFPAIMVFWAVSKIVHHGSSCCRGLDQYYCLPPRIYEPSRVWTLDFFEKHNQHQKKDIQREFQSLNFGSSKHGHVTDEEDSVEHMEIIGHPSDSVDRVDHYTQLLPETLINTDDEIAYLTGSEDERQEDMFLRPLENSNDDDVYLKY